MPASVDRQWGDDATAQDVVDALRLVLMSQRDDREAMKVVRLLVDQAPETASNRGADLVMEYVADGELKLAIVEPPPIPQSTPTDTDGDS